MKRRNRLSSKAAAAIAVAVGIRAGSHSPAAPVSEALGAGHEPVPAAHPPTQRWGASRQRQWPMRAVRRHGRQYARRACCTRSRREARHYSAAAGRFARRGVGRTVAAQAGRKSRRVYRTHHGTAQRCGRGDGYSCDGTQAQVARTEE